MLELNACQVLDLLNDLQEMVLSAIPPISVMEIRFIWHEDAIEVESRLSAIDVLVLVEVELLDIFYV